MLWFDGCVVVLGSLNREETNVCFDGCVVVLVSLNGEESNVRVLWLCGGVGEFDFGFKCEF